MKLKQGALLKRGEYRIEEILGQGGFGITYKAVQVALKRVVAIKEFFVSEECLRVSSSESKQALVATLKQKFLREAQLITTFDNRHIVRVTDVFEENATAYYVMDYLGEENLESLVSAYGAVDEKRALFYIRHICDALTEVHAKHYLHLDIKPSNIMLNKSGEAVLIDFGVSKHYNSSGSQTSYSIVGHSDGYTPLEQDKGGDVSQFTPATDIYALGATFYFLLTRMRPPMACEVMNNGLPPLPHGISASVRRAIEAAMQPKRNDRPQSVNEFLSLLDEVEPVGAVGQRTDSAEATGDGSDDSAKYNVILLSAGPRKLEVLKSFKEASGLDLKAAKDLIDAAPCIISKGLSRHEAEALKNIIEQTEGASVVIEAAMSDQLVKADEIIDIRDLPPFAKYHHVSDFSEGMAMAIRNGKCGFVDKSYKEIIPCKYDEAYQFRDGVAQVKKDGRWILIDRDGRELSGSVPKREEHKDSASDANLYYKQESNTQSYRQESYTQRPRRNVGCSFPFFFLLGLILLARACVGCGAEDGNVMDEQAMLQIDTAGYINTYKYIDLGLPSGVKWATENVGAHVFGRGECGGHYAWGETTVKNGYTLKNSKTRGEKITKIGGTEYDVARKLWGAPWRMPTRREFDELYRHCTTKLDTVSGVEGVRFTSKINSNSIFLPFAGLYIEDKKKYEGEKGYYWNSDSPEYNNDRAKSSIVLKSRTGKASTDTFYEERYYGMSVRPVCD